MDYISLAAVLSMTMDTTVELAQLATLTESTTGHSLVENTACYRQGAFSFGYCDMSVSAGGHALDSIWLIANLLFAFMFFNPNIKRGWKVLTFLVGMPGTFFIAVFMQLFGARWKRRAPIGSQTSDL